MHKVYITVVVFFKSLCLGQKSISPYSSQLDLLLLWVIAIAQMRPTRKSESGARELYS